MQTNQCFLLFLRFIIFLLYNASRMLPYILNRSKDTYVLLYYLWLVFILLVIQVIHKKRTLNQYVTLVTDWMLNQHDKLTTLSLLELFSLVVHHQDRNMLAAIGSK
jgi:hypothetical protein